MGTACQGTVRPASAQAMHPHVASECWTHRPAHLQAATQSAGIHGVYPAPSPRHTRGSRQRDQYPTHPSRYACVSSFGNTLRMERPRAQKNSERDREGGGKLKCTWRTYDESERIDTPGATRRTRPTRKEIEKKARANTRGRAIHASSERREEQKAAKN